METEGFLPISREDMEKQNIEQLDFCSKSICNCRLTNFKAHLLVVNHRFCYNFTMK